MVMEMVHPLHDPVLCGPGGGDVVPSLEVRHHVAEAHPASVRTHRNSLSGYRVGVLDSSSFEAAIL